ncbi:PTS lactose/cellobiose transporter subunit IIA [Collinsella provencensis]|uniref:PTS lactose/cellobiose transporter subunit IIA n=1 Tax=Collinsella provencensis TaxID=1937461 RepID=UPI000C828AAD|nr:PTS lactose/cellobiose transporter subunit IIA [Collinsella provencensis]
MHSADELNQAAMQIILSAGDCREMLNEVIDMLTSGATDDDVDVKLRDAKKEIARAHVIQTDMIQESIETDILNTTLLFTHAQDTLMTINSEVNMVTNMIKMYRALRAGREG